MRPLAFALIAAALWSQAGCSSAEKPAAPPPAKTAEARAPDPVRITQFYATAPTVHPREKALLCYGVEDARAVWLSPPRRYLGDVFHRVADAHGLARSYDAGIAGWKPAPRQWRPRGKVNFCGGLPYDYLTRRGALSCWKREHSRRVTARWWPWMA
jgi:hypothetical protein